MDGFRLTRPQIGTPPSRLIPTEPPSVPRIAPMVVCPLAGGTHLRSLLRLPTIVWMFRRVLKARAIGRVKRKRELSIHQERVLPRLPMRKTLTPHQRFRKGPSVLRISTSRALHHRRRSQRMSPMALKLWKSKNPRDLRSLKSLLQLNRLPTRLSLPLHYPRSGFP